MNLRRFALIASSFVFSVGVFAQSADISIAKGPVAPTATAGQTTTFILVVSSPAGADPADVTVTDTTPAGTTLNTINAVGYTCSGVAPGGTGTITCVRDTQITAGTNDGIGVALNIDSSVADGTVITNTGNVAVSGATDPDSSNNTASGSVTVTTSADLTVTKSDTPDPVTAGQNITYTLTLTNAGPSDAANVSVDDAVPAGTTFVFGQQTSGPTFSCSGPPTITCTIPSFAAGATATFQLIVQVAPSTPDGSIITNTANVTSTTGDSNGADNSATATTTVATEADLAVSKSGPLTSTPGADITYNVNIINNGPSDATNVVLSDNQPALTTFVSAGQTSGPAFACTAPPAIVCTIASLAAGASANFSLTVASSPAAPDGSVVENTATANSSTADSTPLNNSSTVQTTVAASADLAVTKTDTPDPVLNGQNITYTVTLTNNGPNDAQSVSLSDSVPAGTTFVSANQTSGPAFVCTAPPAIVCTIATFATTDVATFELVVSVDAATTGTVTNTVSVSATTADPAGGNNSATATTTVTPTADLTITKSDTPDPVVAGNQITYVVSVINNGPNDAPNVQITDNIPGQTTFASANQLTGPAATCTAPPAIVCTIASLPAGQSASFELVVNVDPAATGTISNTSTVTSGANDPNAADNSATATTTVTSPADLAVTKSGVPPLVNPGGQITYTATITNNGPADAQNVSLSDTIPAQTTFSSATQTSGPTFACSGPPAIVCTIATLTSGTSATFELVVDVDPTATGIISNTVNVASTTPDNTPGNNSANVLTLVQAAADLVVTKNDSPDPVSPGGTITYTATITNNGPNDAQNVSFNDTIPAQTTFASATQTAGPTFACSAPPTITCTIATLTSGSTATFQLVVNVDPTATGTITNTIVANSLTPDPAPLNNGATATTTVTPTADLSVTKSDSPDPVTAGSNITYTATITNNGPSDAQTVTLSDTIPAGTSFVSATQLSGPTFVCTAPPAIVCSIATLTSGDSATFQLVVSVDPATTGTITNTVTVGSATADNNAGNNSATATTTVTALAADLSVTKSDSPDPVTPGNNITYTATITNNGPNDAQNVSLSDTVPAGTTFVSATQTSGPTFVCTGPPTLTCTLATLPSGASATFQMVVNVNNSTTGTVTNTVTVSSTTADGNNANNSATATTTVTATADLGLTKTDTPDPVAAGGTLTYTLTLVNNGPSDATTVQLSDTVPAGTTFSSINQTSGPAFVCAGGATTTCTAASFVSGGTATFTLVVTVDPATSGIISNTATVTAATSDPNAGNNSATAATTVNPSTDVAITKVTGTGPFTAGGNVDFTITVTNNGPQPATNVTVTDTLPAGSTLVSATPSQGTCSGAGPVTCTLGSIAVSGTATIGVVVQSSAVAGPMTNTASVTATEADPNPANNTASANATTGALSADLAITKTAGAGPFVTGDNVDFMITVTNNGPSTATGVSVTDTIPAGTTFVSATPSQGSCTGAGPVVCTIGTMASGATVTIPIVVNAPAAGPLTNTATVSATSPVDANAANDTATANATVGAAAAIPTMSQWALLLMACMLAVIALKSKM